MPNALPIVVRETPAVRVALGTAADPIGVLKGVETDLLNLIEQPCAELHEADEAMLRDMLRRVRLGLAYAECDPGDDAVDETLLRKPAPTLEAA
jgi:hypothetical protein